MAKPSRQNADFGDLIAELKAQSKLILDNKDENQSKLSKASTSIVDIVTFCEDPAFLNLAKQNIRLRLSQKIIIKCLYIGSRGNEKLRLTQEEKDWLKEKNLNYVIKKVEYIENKKDIKPNELFDHLILVLGRRSGKTFLCSIIAAYEAYKLLELPGGCPQKYYSLPSENEIVILNVARSSKQAKVLFNEISSRLRCSPYFRGRIDINSTTTEEIRLFTNQDKETNKDPDNPIHLSGTIALVCGHSSSESLRGRGAIIVMFDELAFMLNTTGGQSGYEIYKALSPTIKTFIEEEDTNRPNGRIIAISSPNGPDGKFYELYKESFNEQKMLMFQLPTWDANPLITRESLASDEKRDPDAFWMEFGAQFAQSGSMMFLPSDQVESCESKTMIVRQEKGTPGIIYYMHLDPAISSHVYALAIGYSQEYQNAFGERKKKVYIVHSQRWVPKDGQDVNIAEVEKYIIDVCKRFHIASITFDQMHSSQTIQNLKRYNLPVRRLAFRKYSQMQMYGTLKELVLRGDLEYYSDYYIKNELKGLRVKYTENGWKIRPNLKSEVPTDDTADCVAAICYLSTNEELSLVKRYPRGMIYNSLHSMSSMGMIHQMYDRKF